LTVCLSWLEGSTGCVAAAEWQEFINCLITNLTAFIREAHHPQGPGADLRARRPAMPASRPHARP